MLVVPYFSDLANDVLDQYLLEHLTEVGSERNWAVIAPLRWVVNLGDGCDRGCTTL